MRNHRPQLSPALLAGAICQTSHNITYIILLWLPDKVLTLSKWTDIRSIGDRKKKKKDWKKFLERLNAPDKEKTANICELCRILIISQTSFRLPTSGSWVEKILVLVALTEFDKFAIRLEIGIKFAIWPNKWPFLICTCQFYSKCDIPQYLKPGLLVKLAFGIGKTNLFKLL